MSDVTSTNESARWCRLLATEARIQVRSGLYAAYTVMTAFFFLLLVLMPGEFRRQGFELIVLLDPSFMGFFFAGGLVLLERDQGILPLILTHGGGFDRYWRAKVTAVLALAAVVILALTVLAHGTGLVSIDLRGVLMLAVGLLLSVPVYFSLGIVLAARHTRVLDYFVYSSIVSLPFMFPLVELVGISVGPAGVLSPIWGGMVFFTSIFPPVRSPLEILLAAGSLIVWNGLAFRWARTAFLRLGTGTGGSVRGGKDPGSGRPRVDRSMVDRPMTVRFGPGRADVTLLLRDPVSRLILGAPFLAAVVLGRIVPLLLNHFAPASILVVVEAHYDTVRSFIILLAALMYGMLGAFLILDEKDEGVLPVLQTMPGRPGWWVLRRGATLLVIFGVFLVPLVFAGDLVHGVKPALSGRFALSLLPDTLALPLAFLVMSILAKNKVQGLALAKVLNVFTIPPLLLAFLPGRPGLLIGLFPTGWGSLMRLRAETPWQLFLYGLAGCLYMGTVILVLYRRLVRRAIPCYDQK